MDKQKLASLGVSTLSIVAVLVVPPPLQVGLSIAGEVCGFLVDNCVHWDKNRSNRIGQAVAEAVEQTLIELPRGEQDILLELVERQTFSMDTAKATGPDALKAAIQAQASRMESYLLQGATPKVLAHISSTFQNAFLDCIRKFPDLNLILSVYRDLCAKVNTFAGRIDAHDKDIDELREWMKNASDEPRLMLPGVAPAVELIGRDGALRDFQERFAAHDKICVISGIGGVGKTEFIRKYLELHGCEYASIGWFEYRTGFLDTLLGTVGLVLNPRAPEDDGQARANELMGLLRGLTRNDVLVFDNVNGDMNREDIERVFGLPCRIVFTTRADFSENQHRVLLYSMEFLTGENCESLFIHYLQRQLKPREMESLPEVVRLAGRHTLALELMAKTCKAARISVMELLERLQRDGFNLDGLAETVRRNGEYDGRRLVEHVVKLFDVADVTALGVEAERLLVNLCVLPLDRVRVSVQDIREWLGLTDLNILNELHERGWLRMHEDDTVSMHGVIAEALRRQLEPDAEKCAPVIDGLFEKINKESYELYLVEDVYFRCTESMLNIINAEEINLSELGNAAARVCQYRGDYITALRYYEKALKISEKVSGEKHHSTATIYSNLAGVYKVQGDYATALRYYEKTLAIRKKVFGKENPSIAMTYNNLAGIYKTQRDYATALNYYEKALAIQEKAYGKEHPHTAVMYGNVAVLYQEKGDYTTALSYYEKVLAIQGKGAKKEQPGKMVTYNNLAGIYQSQGDYATALNYYKKALVISEKVLGKEHPNTGIIYVNMGALYTTTNEWEQAKEYCQKGYDILLKKLGEQHLNTQIAAKWLQNICEKNDFRS